MKLEFHHINIVTKNVENLNNFYNKILQMEVIPQENFPRSEETKDSGYSGKINFLNKNNIQFHIAEKDLNVSFKNKQVLNPVKNGHIAFRTDNIEEFIKILEKEKIPFSDYGTAFAKEWHQIFFQDPEGNIIEVHQKVK